MIQENMTSVIPETPAEGFALLEDALYSAESISVYTDVERRNPGGDLYTVTAYYICPEGRRVDVDAYVPTHEVLTIEMDFDNEIPDEVEEGYPPVPSIEECEREAERARQMDAWEDEELERRVGA